MRKLSFEPCSWRDGTAGTKHVPVDDCPNLWRECVKER
jgi:hypothetical protein